MEKLHQKAQERAEPRVSRKNVKESLLTQNTYIIRKPSQIITKPKERMWTDWPNKFKWILWT
jgi:hypothetical protein